MKTQVIEEIVPVYLHICTSPRCAASPSQGYPQNHWYQFIHRLGNMHCWGCDTKEQSNKTLNETEFCTINSLTWNYHKTNVFTFGIKSFVSFARRNDQREKTKLIVRINHKRRKRILTRLLHTLPVNSTVSLMASVHCFPRAEL